MYPGTGTGLSNMLLHRVLILAFYIASFEVHWLERSAAYRILHVLIILFNLRFLVPHLRWLAPLPTRIHKALARSRQLLKTRAPSPKLPQAPPRISSPSSPPAILRAVPTSFLPPNPPVPIYPNQLIPPKEAFLTGVSGLRDLHVLPEPTVNGRLAPRLLIICQDGVGMLLHREIAMIKSATLGHHIFEQRVIPFPLPDIMSVVRLHEAVSVDGVKEDVTCLCFKKDRELWRYPAFQSYLPILAQQGKMPYPVYIRHVPEASDLMLPILRSWYADDMDFRMCSFTSVASVFETAVKYDVTSKLLDDTVDRFLRAQLTVDPFEVYVFATKNQLYDMRHDAAHYALALAPYDDTRRVFLTNLPSARLLQEQGGQAFDDLVRLQTTRNAASLATFISGAWMEEIPGALARRSHCERMQQRVWRRAAMKRGIVWWAHPEEWEYIDTVKELLGRFAAPRAVAEVPIKVVSCGPCKCASFMGPHNELKNMVLRALDKAMTTCYL
ncbi:unnamed protein product [Peniophora sp. CBMAI 1063]|nr:unnamed protein product [Peniophora sp. CBMAI 1063]